MASETISIHWFHPKVVSAYTLCFFFLENILRAANLSGFKMFWRLSICFVHTVKVNGVLLYCIEVIQVWS